MGCNASAAHGHSHDRPTKAASQAPSTPMTPLAPRRREQSEVSARPHMDDESTVDPFDHHHGAMDPSSRQRELALIRQFTQADGPESPSRLPTVHDGSHIESKGDASVDAVFFGDNTANYDLVHIINRDEPYSPEEVSVAQALRHSLNLRQKYQGGPSPANFRPSPAEAKQWSSVSVATRDGVIRVLDAQGQDLAPVIEYSEFEKDVMGLWQFVKSGPAKSQCFLRLGLLQKKFEMYHLLNASLESKSIRNDPKDFYNIYKVDNHIHAAACMTCNHLLHFVKDKLRNEPHETVWRENGKEQTLHEVFSEMGLREEDVTIDALDVSADSRMFHRFDHFNAAYNLFGQSKLRDIFLKTDNVLRGRYFAELLKQVLKQTRQTGNNVLLEPRLSIYGTHIDNWKDLAGWFVDNNIGSEDVRWLIQVPRIYASFRKKDLVSSFEHWLNNIFSPLFDVSLKPSSNPKLAKLLENVVGFDSVDDESVYDEIVARNPLPPGKQTDKDSATLPYSYFAYYFYANIQTLNMLRKMRGLNTFAFRPHCGEAGEEHHLATMFLLAHGINHGIKLKRTPTLTYLYYLAQIGISVAPLSNNVLFCKLSHNPFKEMLQIGLNVTLSTDDPLQFHSTQEPLIEEYTIARQFWNLSVTDLSEVAVNSVKQSGFSHQRKVEMLGPGYAAYDGNDVRKTNVPNCRVAFRRTCRLEEYRFIWNASKGLSRANRQLHNVKKGWKWLVDELRASTMWRATMDFNLPDNGDYPYPDFLSFRKGDLIMVFRTSLAYEEVHGSSDDAVALLRHWSDMSQDGESKEKAEAAAANDRTLALTKPVHAAELAKQNVTTDLDSFCSDLWFGRDSHGREGLFPASYGTVVKQGDTNLPLSLVNLK